MEKTDLEIGDVVQISPESQNPYSGMLLVVTEPKSWGCQGYLLHTGDFPATRYKDKAYLRVKWEDMEYVGKMQWMEKKEDEDEN